MKTFVSALLFAAVYAESHEAEAAATEESSVVDDAANALEGVANWFAEKAKDALAAGASEQPFGSYNATETENGLTATISLDSTAVGVNFVRYEAHYTGPSFNANTSHLIYFTVEEPATWAADAADARFLQEAATTAETTETAAEEPVVTGNGSYEGAMYAFSLAPTTGDFVEKRSAMLTGLTNCDDQTQWFTNFCGTNAVNIVEDSAYQVERNEYTAATADAAASFKYTAWRLAQDIGDGAFKFVVDQPYYGCSGHRRYASASQAGQSVGAGRTGVTKFQFDAANTTLLGVGAIAAAVMTMF